MYNAEDFIMDTVREANDLHYKPFSRFNSIHYIKWQVEDILLKMRYHDLFHENRNLTEMEAMMIVSMGKN